MALVSNARAAACAAALAASASLVCARADTPPVLTTYAGVQALVVVGQHQDIAGTQRGVGAGPLLQARVGGRRVALAIEGIPVVGIPGVKPSAAYGQATPSLGIFNGQLEYALTEQRTLWLGLGETVYNQRTPLPAQDQVVSSRLAGLRYTARYLHAFNAAHSLEAFLGAAPSLSGSDVYVATGGGVVETKPERASEIDASLAFVYSQHSTQWLLGLRTVNFAAKFTNTGEAADRNVGIGPMIEWRHLFEH